MREKERERERERERESGERGFTLDPKFELYTMYTCKNLTYINKC